MDFVLSRAKWNSIYPGKGKFNIFLKTQIQYIVAAGLTADGGKDEKIRNTRLFVRARLRTLDGIWSIVSRRDNGKFRILIIRLVERYLFRWNDC